MFEMFPHYAVLSLFQWINPLVSYFFTIISNGWTLFGIWNWSEPTRLFWSVVVIFPILLHLYGKMRKQVVDFPAARFLTDLHTSRIHAEHWRNLGLLALRCFVILLIVIAAAVPFSDHPIKNSLVSSPFESPVCHLFVIDGSASMLAQNRSGESGFDLAIRKIREQISVSHEGDRFGVWVAAESVVGCDVAPTSRLTEFQRRLDRLECTLGTANLQNLFDTLIHRLENPHFLRNQERCQLTILSDLDASTWEYPLESSLDIVEQRLNTGSSVAEGLTQEDVWMNAARRLAELADVRLVPVGTPPSENIGVKNLRVEMENTTLNAESPNLSSVESNRDDATTERAWNIAAEVFRKGGKNPRNVPITLWINDHMMEQKSVTLTPNALAKIEFSNIQIPENIRMEPGRPLTEKDASQELFTSSTHATSEPLSLSTSEALTNGRMIRVRVTCDSDRFPLDDVCETNIRYAQQLSILLVDTRTGISNVTLDAGPLRWITAALAPFKAAGPVRVETVSWREFPFTTLDRFDGILIPDPPELRPEMCAILERYVRLGGAVWIFTGSAWKTSEELYPVAKDEQNEGLRTELLNEMLPIPPSTLPSSNASSSLLSDTMGKIPPFRAAASPAIRTDFSTELFSQSSNHWFPATVRGLQNVPTTVLLSGETETNTKMLSPRSMDSQTIRNVKTYNTEVFKIFTGRNEAEIPLLRYRLLVPRSDAKVLWRTADGDPLLVESRCGRGVTLVTAFGLTPSDTLFVVLPSFVPFVQEVLAYLRPRATSDVSLVVPAMSEVSFRFRTTDAAFLQMIRENLGWKWQNDESADQTPSNSVNVVGDEEPSETEKPGKFQMITLPKWEVTVTQWMLLLAICLWIMTLFRKEE